MLRVIEWVNPWRMQVQAFRLRDNFKAGNDGLHHLVVCNGTWRHPEYDRWASFKSVIERARKLGAASYELESAEIEALDGGAEIPWQETEGMAVRVGITWNPSDSIYWPPQLHTVLPGQVVAIPPGRWTAINMGKTQRLHLCLSLRQTKDEGEAA